MGTQFGKIIKKYSNEKLSNMTKTFGEIFNEHRQ